MIPKVGDSVLVRGQSMKVLQLRPLGTIDVEAADGRCFRVTGLNFHANMTRIPKVKPPLCLCRHRLAMHRTGSHCTARTGIGGRGRCSCDGYQARKARS